MRQITQDAYKAFVHGKNFSRGNTHVERRNGESYMYLFGNMIAKTENGNVLINHCGYKTSTTRERLSAFYSKIRKSGNELIVNEKFVWEEGWLNINDLR